MTARSSAGGERGRQVAGVRWGVMLALLGVVQCADVAPVRTDRADDASDGSRALADGVVARVDGSAIRVEEVERVVRHTGLSPLEALGRLEEERLLMHEAQRRGFGALPGPAKVGKQSMVQALLADEVEPVSVSEEEIEAAYAEAGTRFDRPQRRASVHVLAKLPKDPVPQTESAARYFAERAIAAFRRDGIEETMQRYQGRTSERFEVVVERLPAFGRDAPLAREYIEAMFAPQEPGVVQEPVRTRFGWHAIVVTGIEPRRHQELGEVRDILARELRLEKRRKRLESLLKRLAAEVPVEREQTVIDQALLSEALLLDDAP